jgi:hypothetical protein
VRLGGMRVTGRAGPEDAAWGSLSDQHQGSRIPVPVVERRSLLGAGGQGDASYVLELTRLVLDVNPACALYP